MAANFNGVAGKTASLFQGFGIFSRDRRSFTLYEDDGESFAYQSGASAETTIVTVEASGVFTCRLGEPRGNFEPAKRERTVVMNVHRQPCMREVSCNAMRLDVLPDAESVDRMSSGWWRDEKLGLLTIKLQPGRAGALTVQVS
jgi:hypothetical protein